MEERKNVCKNSTKNSFSTERLYTKDALLMILFQPITARHFLIAAPFPACPMLTIPLDKRQMKSFENINILIEVKLFCLKNFCFSKKIFLGKRLFLKKFFIFGKKLFYLCRIKVLVPKSSGT